MIEGLFCCWLGKVSGSGLDSGKGATFLLQLHFHTSFVSTGGAQDDNTKVHAKSAKIFRKERKVFLKVSGEEGKGSRKERKDFLQRAQSFFREGRGG